MRRLLFVLVFAALVPCTHGLAQSTAATVSGSVLDEQKAALPGATVTDSQSRKRPAANHDDRRARRISDRRPAARHAMKSPAELAGFGRLVRSDLSLTVAQEVTLALTLRVAALRGSGHGHRRTAARRDHAIGARHHDHHQRDRGAADCGPQFRDARAAHARRDQHRRQRHFVRGPADAQQHVPDRRPEQRR